MPAIVYQTNKKSGITYAYESVSYWDKEKQQSRAKRKCIGKLDPETGKIVPTRKKKPKTKKGQENKKPGLAAINESTRYFYGATYLLDQIGEKLGIAHDLKHCFPDRHRKIRSIAYYLIMEESSSLLRFPKWAALHKHPCSGNISSPRSSELFASITAEEREQFFRRQGNRRAEKEYWVYDITTISSYSNCLQQVKYGDNKEQDPLAQINLALIFGEQSNLPFYYRKLFGNILDVKTVKNLVADMIFLVDKKVKLVMDCGFYSVTNINELLKNHFKFLIPTRLNLPCVEAALEKVGEELPTRANYSQQYDVYATAKTITWDYRQQRPDERDERKSNCRLYLHLYYNMEKATEDACRQNLLLIHLQRELQNGNRKQEHEKLYAEYFEVYSTPVRGTKVKVKQEAIGKPRRTMAILPCSVMRSKILLKPLPPIAVKN